MPASDTYVLKSLAFTPSGSSQIILNGLESISWREGGQVVQHQTDADVAIGAHFLDSLEGEVGAQLKNPSFLAEAGLRPGMVGTLVATYQLRKGGKGAVVGEDKTITATQAMVGNLDATLPQVGTSDLSIAFHCSAADGINIFTFG